MTQTLPSNITQLPRWADSKTVRAFTRFSRRLTRTIGHEVDPRILLLLCRMNHACEQFGRGLSIDEAAERFCFERPVLEAMRSVGILDQQRGYQQFGTADKSVMTDPEMVPLFFVSDAWKKLLAPMMQLDCVVRPTVRAN